MDGTLIIPIVAVIATDLDTWLVGGHETAHRRPNVCPRWSHWQWLLSSSKLFWSPTVSDEHIFMSWKYTSAHLKTSLTLAALNSYWSRSHILVLVRIAQGLLVIQAHKYGLRPCFCHCSLLFALSLRSQAIHSLTVQSFLWEIHNNFSLNHNFRHGFDSRKC